MATTLDAHPSADDREITVTRVLDADVARVWTAWTDAEQLRAWWGPKGFTCPMCRIDPRPGGIWHLDMQAPDGTIFPCRGEFIEVVEQQRLVYSDRVDEKDPVWGSNPPPNCTQIIRFEDLGGSTRLSITMRMDSAADRERMASCGVEGCWNSSVDRLADLLSAGASQEAAGEGVAA